jgi:hypothetical protein
MSKRDALQQALAPILEVVSGLDLNDPDAAKAALDEKLPSDGETIARIREMVREGVAAGELANREADGVRFGRVLKPSDDTPWSIDLVHMSSPGPAHTHPNGEVDLCFAVDGEPKFDERVPGWTVYGPGSWHVPSVTEGVMDILYFLPGGAIEFGPKPEA